MTRTHAARQLLALGPLTFAQFSEITGWSASACRWVLSYLVDSRGEAERLGRVYRMTDGKQLHDLSALEAQGQRSDGSASASQVCAGSAVVIPPAEAKLPETQAGCARCGRCACGLGGEGVKA